MGMLADLSETCPPNFTSENILNPGITKIWNTLLNSAKANLCKLAFFGLTEYQELSAELFEWTFSLKFKTDFSQKNSNKTRASGEKVSMSKGAREKVNKLILHEKQLYRYAKDIFFKRLKLMKSTKS